MGRNKQKTATATAPTSTKPKTKAKGKGKGKGEAEPTAPSGRGGGGVRGLLVTLVVLVAAIVAVVAFAYREVGAGRSATLDEVYELADAGAVESATLLDEDARLLADRCVARGDGGACDQVQSLVVEYPESDVATQQLIDRLAAGGATVAIDQQTPKAVAKFAAMFILPLALLANLFGLVFLWRAAGEGQADEVAGFSKLAAGDQQGGSGVQFADVAGADEALAELREVSDYLAAPEQFAGYGAAAPKGVLLLGPPGCGKTLLAKAVAGESRVPFFSVAGTEFVESLVGVGAARVRDLFAQVRAAAPAIVFIDEIDAVGRARGGEGAMSGGEREQTLNQLLVELDGFDPATGIVLIGATNRADILDRALLRPGRFDRRVTVSPPDVAGREAVLRLHAAARPVAGEVDFAALARRTPGFTGADLANVVNEAALLAIRAEGRAQLTDADFSEAVMRVMHGPQRFGVLLSDSERHRLAAHEAGHALVAAALADQRLDRLSILPRGGGLAHAHTTSDSDGDRVLATGGELAGRLAAGLGGLAAEQLMTGEVATTADADLAQASELAREIAGRYGLSPSLGRLRILHTAAGHTGARGGLEPVSGQTLAEFDGEVRRLLAAAEQAATDVLTSHRDTLDRLVAALTDRETLEGHALEQLLAPARGHAHTATTILTSPNGHQPTSTTPATKNATTNSGASKNATKSGTSKTTTGKAGAKKSGTSKNATGKSGPREDTP